MNTTNTIAQQKQKWGSKLLILGHHYERSSVLKHADSVGDSLELARIASEQRDAERIVFCGVRFMAESADVLTTSSQSVYMPDPDAGCPMADMADVDKLKTVWSFLTESAGQWTPIVYVNSSAPVKSFCGARGGSACTSSNALEITSRELKRGNRVLFLPDEHLGTNTAVKLGLERERIAYCDPAETCGGLSQESVEKASMIIWRGFCHVHTAFTLRYIRAIRENYADARIIVHPEVPYTVASQADELGSTAQIIRYVESLPDGSTVFVGTERHLVERLASIQGGRVDVRPLANSTCTDMALTDEDKLADLLTKWPDSHRVSVPDSIAHNARKCLEKMLSK